MSEPGFVYILTNPSFREDWVKIGKSSRPVDVRSKELDNTAVPLPFEIYATMKTVKYNEAEKLVHRYIERFTNLRIRDNREFFNVKPEVALDIFREIADVIDDAVIEEVHKKNIMGSTVQPGYSRSNVTPPRADKKVWLVASNSNFFDLKGCFDKYGAVYWSQYFNYQKGDTGYIYSASPDSAIRFKFVVEEQDLRYSPDMDRELQFYTNPQDIENARKHNRLALFRITGETKNPRLGLANLIDHGLKGAPQGAVILSKAEYSDILSYIEDNF